MTDQTQIAQTITALQTVLGPNMLGAYLHGSAISGGLRGQSDIDIMLVLRADPSPSEFRLVLHSLMRLSSRHPRRESRRRCLEVIAFRAQDMVHPRCPQRAAFLYGEWLRAGFMAGAALSPHEKADHTLILAQARGQSQALYGPPVQAFLPPMSQPLIRKAIGLALPDLLNGLAGDERNVMLTLARMWRSASHGDFLPKDQAAAWAIAQLPAQECAVLNLARKGYLGTEVDDYKAIGAQAADLAESLTAHIRQALKGNTTSL